MTEETDPFCLAPAAGAEVLAGAPWRRFGTVGDSLSAGTGGPTPGYASLGWPRRVADVLRRIHPGLAYLELAEVGATTSDTLAEQMDRLAAFEPDLVHLPSAANDLFQAVPDYAVIADELGQVFDRAAATGAQLTVFTLGRAFVVPRYADWSDRVRRVNDIVRALTAHHDAVLVDMWDHPVNLRPGLVSADRIHFGAAGQAVMATEIVKALGSLLAHPGPHRLPLPGPATGRDQALAAAARLRERGHADRALPRLLELAAEHPDDAQIAYQTAWAHDVLGLEAGAVPFYERSVAGSRLAANDLRDALLGLGSTYRVLGRYADAEKILRRGTEEFPDDAALRAFLAMALYNTGHHHEATTTLLTVLARTTGDTRVHRYRPAIEHYARNLGPVEPAAAHGPCPRPSGDRAEETERPGVVTGDAGRLPPVPLRPY